MLSLVKILKAWSIEVELEFPLDIEVEDEFKLNAIFTVEKQYVVGVWKIQISCVGYGWVGHGITMIVDGCIGCLRYI